MRKLFLVLLGAGMSISMNAQSPDSRICSCFATSVTADHMTGTKASFGNSIRLLTRDMEIKPQALEPVKFEIPKIESKTGCTSWYKLYVADAQNKKVYESSGAVNVRSFAFPACDQSYYVTLMAYSQSANGNDGNCSRSLHIKVTPQCIAANCKCGTDKSSKSGISLDLNITGNIECLTPSSNQRKYVLKFSILNKSNCVLIVESITVHGQTIPVPAFKTAPRTTTKGISLGFSTPLAQSPPAESAVSAVVRYMVGEQHCSAVIEIPYLPCR